jgi:hypothetical protein
MESGTFIETHLGFLKWHGALAPYEQKVLEAELVLKNKSAEVLSFINVSLENTPESTILSESKHFIPRLSPAQSASIAFRLASLQENFNLKAALRFDTQSTGYIRDTVEIKIPGEAKIRHDSHLIFISYCSRDLDAIQSIIAGIKTSQFRIWMAAHEIGEIDWFPDLIRSALDQAYAFIIFLSKHSIQSVWVTDELKIALQQIKMGKLQQIIPVQIDRSQVPPALMDYQPIANIEDKEKALEQIVNRLNESINKRARSSDSNMGWKKMDDPQRRHLEELRRNHQRRLHVLELQAASFGLSAPPHVLIEIEDIRAQIASLDTQLAESQQSALQLPISPEQPKKNMRTHTEVLTVLANPKGTDPLRLGEEDRVIRECIQRSKNRDNITLDIRHAARIDDFARALLEKDYHIVQFSGHGTGQGLSFENELGEVQIVPKEALAETLSAYSPPVECVILNACYSDVHVQDLSSGVPYTIVMAGPISDEGATEFTRGFYDAIGAGKNIEFAYQEGCRRIKLKALPDAATPALYKR